MVAGSPLRMASAAQSFSVKSWPAMAIGTHAFLVDTGADRTVLSASAYVKLGFGESEAREQLGGLGGLTEAVFMDTQIRLTRDGGGKVMFRGNYAAVTDDAALDFSVLGRDLMGLFAVIVDDLQQIVCLLRQHHRYIVVEN
jgi:predicted aspartyl protease